MIGYTRNIVVCWKPGVDKSFFFSFLSYVFFSKLLKTVDVVLFILFGNCIWRWIPTYWLCDWRLSDFLQFIIHKHIARYQVLLTITVTYKINRHVTRLHDKQFTLNVAVNVLKTLQGNTVKTTKSYNESRLKQLKSIRRTASWSGFNKQQSSFFPFRRFSLTVFAFEKSVFLASKSERGNWKFEASPKYWAKTAGAFNRWGTHFITCSMSCNKLVHCLLSPCLKYFCKTEFS